MHRLRLLITGCGRSGTRFITRTLNEAGFATYHEGIGGEATVSWYFAPTFTQYQFPNRVHRDGIRAQDVSYDETFLQVRHPLHVIGSLRHALNEHDWDYVRAHLPNLSNEPLVREMQYWVWWNELALKRKPTLVYRVEALASSWGEICERLGITTSLPPKVPTDLNTRGKYEPVNWEMLDSVGGSELTTQVITLASQLGYEV